MTTFIICATIIVCVFIIFYYTDKFNERTLEKDNTVNSIFDDTDTILNIVKRIENVEIYNDTVKHTLLTIKHITSKYVEETKGNDESTTES